MFGTVHQNEEKSRKHYRLRGYGVTETLGVNFLNFYFLSPSQQSDWLSSPRNIGPIGNDLTISGLS